MLSLIAPLPAGHAASTIIMWSMNKHKNTWSTSNSFPSSYFWPLELPDDGGTLELPAPPPSTTIVAAEYDDASDAPALLAIALLTIGFIGSALLGTLVVLLILKLRKTIFNTIGKANTEQSGRVSPDNVVCSPMFERLSESPPRSQAEVADIPWKRFDVNVDGRVDWCEANDLVRPLLEAEDGPPAAASKPSLRAKGKRMTKRDSPYVPRDVSEEHHHFRIVE